MVFENGVGDGEGGEGENAEWGWVSDGDGSLKIASIDFLSCFICFLLHRRRAGAMFHMKIRNVEDSRTLWRQLML